MIYRPCGRSFSYYASFSSGVIWNLFVQVELTRRTLSRMQGVKDHNLPLSPFKRMIYSIHFLLSFEYKSPRPCARCIFEMLLVLRTLIYVARPSFIPVNAAWNFHSLTQTSSYIYKKSNSLSSEWLFPIESTFTYTHNATFVENQQFIEKASSRVREFAKKVEIGWAACGAAESAAIIRTSLCNFQQFSRTQKATSLIHPNNMWSAQRGDFQPQLRNHLPRTDNRIDSISHLIIETRKSVLLFCPRPVITGFRPSISLHSAHKSLVLSPRATHNHRNWRTRFKRRSGQYTKRKQPEIVNLVGFQHEIQKNKEEI